jgi:uncharacterized membrane protein YdjX (TVP38/TMEM64 family)
MPETEETLRWSQMAATTNGSDGSGPQLLSGVGVLRLLLVAVVLAGAIVGVVLQDEVGLAEIRDTFAAAGAWAPLLFIFVYVIATLVYLPGPLITMTGGLLFGVYWGTLYSMVGAVIGGVLAFLIARYLARSWFERKLGPNVRAVKHGVDDEGGWFVLFARLVPVFPYAVLNYGFGLTRIGLLPYTLGSVVGIAPATFAYCYLGETGMRVVEGDDNGVRAALVVIAVLAALIFVPRLIASVRRRMQEEKTSN